MHLTIGISCLVSLIHILNCNTDNMGMLWIAIHKLCYDIFLYEDVVQQSVDT